MHIKERFAAEARENALQKQNNLANARTTSPIEGNTQKPNDYADAEYEELKRRYNTLNENELRELIAKGQKSRDEFEPMPGGSAQPSFDRSLKPQQQTQQISKYNLRTVSSILRQ